MLFENLEHCALLKKKAILKNVFQNSISNSMEYWKGSLKDSRTNHIITIFEIYCY